MNLAHKSPHPAPTTGLSISSLRLRFSTLLVVASLVSVVSAPVYGDTEPNDDLATAYDTGLSGVGSVTVTGDAIDAPPLTRNLDIDIFKFTIPAASGAAPMLVTAEVLSDGSGLDPYVRLLDNVGEALVGDDDISADNTDARLATYILSPGMYFVGVSSSSNSTYNFGSLDSAITENSTSGGFKLTITVEAQPAIDSSLEPNDVSSNATPVIGPSFVAAGQFIGDGPNGRRDLDRYRISITGPTIVEAAVKVDHLDSTLDPALSMGAIGVNDDDKPTTHDARLRVALFDPGDYTITVLGAGRVGHSSGTGAATMGSVGYYDLSVDLTPMAVSGGLNEPNDSILEATVVGDLSGGQSTLSGFLGDGRFANSRGDVDVYEVSGDADDQVTVDVIATGAAPTLDPVVTVYDYYGAELAHDDNGGGGLDSRVTVSIPDPNNTLITPTVYVMVRGAGQAPTQDPFTPDPADTTQHASEHVVIDGPRSTGSYDITFTAGMPRSAPGITRPGPDANRVTREPVVRNAEIDQREQDARTAPSAAPSRIVGTNVGGAEDGVVQLDPNTGATLTAFDGPEGIVAPHTGLTLTNQDDLYILGSGRFPRLYRSDPVDGTVRDSLTLWMGSGYYGDIADLGGILYLTDLIDQSVHAFDPAAVVATGELLFSDGGGMPRVKISGPIGALPHPDRLLLSDYANREAVVFAVDPAGGQIDESFASLLPCLCDGDYNSNGVVDSIDSDIAHFDLAPNDPRLDLDCDGVVDSADQGILDCQIASGIPSDPNCCPAMLPPAGVESILSMPCPCSGDFDFDGDLGADDAAEFAQCVFDAFYLSGQIRTGCSPADMNCDELIDSADEAIFNCRQAGDGVPPNDDCCTTGLPEVSVEAFALAGRRSDQILVTDGETPFIKIYDRGGPLINTLEAESPLGSLGAETSFVFADVNEDGMVDLVDFAAMADCLSPPTVGVATGCWIFDAQPDNHVDLMDFARFQEAVSE